MAPPPSARGPNLWPTLGPLLTGGWTCVSYHMYTVVSDPPTTTTTSPASSSPNDNKQSSSKLKLQLHSKPHGDHPLGKVLISPNGYLSANIARRDRLGKLPSGKKWQVGNDEEVSYVARGLSCYCGYLSLYRDEGGVESEEKGKRRGEGGGQDDENDDGGFVDEGYWWATQVEVASDPERVGGEEVRRVRLRRDGETWRVVGMELRPERDLVADVSSGFFFFLLFIWVIVERGCCAGLVC